MQKEKDVRILELMTRIYCRAKHKTKKGLCDECAELLIYATQRREKCPFGDEKTFCSNCKIHCYKPEMREKIAKVMRFSGPRTVFYHPTVAFGHLFETLKYKRKSKKEEKERNKNVKENN